MNKEQIEARILELLSKHVDDTSTLSPQTRIVSDTKMDSVNVMDFVLELEDEFDITVPLNQLAEVQTVADLVEAVTMAVNKT